MNRKLVFPVLGAAMVLAGTLLVLTPPLLSLASKTVSNGAGYDIFGDELRVGEYFTIIRDDGQILDKTARRVYVGDEFIAEDNKRYKVTKIDGQKALAKFVANEEIALITSAMAPAEASQAANKISIYHTHSDESYVPTDGTESIPGKGGIFKVGAALSKNLQGQGIQAVNDTTPHEPHDANAYRRSRRTAVRLLEGGPAAIIDVHRDGIPDPDFYNAMVSGEDISKIRLVVGRQNANMGANLDFAKRIKAYADQVHPGLVKGIFLARGNYNQDLSPRSILIEVGTYTNNRIRAESGAELFGQVIPKVVGIQTPSSKAGPGGGGGVAPSTGGDWRGIFWVLVLFLVGGGAYLLISTGSLSGSVGKLRQFVGREWTNFLLPLGQGKGKGNRLEEPEDGKKSETNDTRKGYQKD